MHRDNHGYGAEPRRGLCSKQFVNDLRDQGLPRDEVIVAVSQVFGIPRGAARLFVLSHPAWAEEETQPTTRPWWRGARF
jgi:hypothetical protein